MIRTIYAQQRASMYGTVGKAFKTSLIFFRDILVRGISETKPWIEPRRRPCYVFVHAASKPARLAAVVCADGKSYYSDVSPPPLMVRRWKERQDNQVMSLEVLAILFALTTVAEWLREHTCVIFSDDVGEAP